MYEEFKGIGRYWNLLVPKIGTRAKPFGITCSFPRSSLLASCGFIPPSSPSTFLSFPNRQFTFQTRSLRCALNFSFSLAGRARLTLLVRPNPSVFSSDVRRRLRAKSVSENHQMSCLSGEDVTEDKSRKIVGDAPSLGYMYRDVVEEFVEIKD